MRLSATKTLKWLAIALVVWFVFLGLAVFGAMLDLKVLVVAAAFGLVTVKVLGACLLIWWLANVAFAVTEWTDERHGKFTKW